MTAPTPEGGARLSAEALSGLARKYRALADLRLARARGEAIPDKQVFRALAREFPGALNELDNLPLDEIERRLDAIARAQGGAPEERWMAWIHGYHALMRAALYVKIRVARREALSEIEASSLAERAAEHAGAAVDAAFVMGVKAPPDGRLNRLVLGRLAAMFGASPAELRATMFPGRPRGSG
ncbi:hypothetical protein SOCEGT47_024980 [Sorangium cellulosum]|uniref:Uncharacterized protein n=1 Tax=Sorangium cellulosum TaxID=56 RepID=A0A4P2PYN8_SORCE|nr:hypothetical protein [Sorangium cellulosum]AUX21997.1 hypothetical protein SOCEGT47_024980 [Sorangium cellulosum]